MIVMNSIFSDDSDERHKFPVYTGFIRYFPLAVAAASRVSYDGNEKHNPGEPMEWSREKANNHADCLVRHLIDGDWGELVWRACALAQIMIEHENGLGAIECATIPPRIRLCDSCRFCEVCGGLEPYECPSWECKNE